MDAKHFDFLARSLTASPSRRGMARVLAGLTLGGLLLPRLVQADMAARKKKGKRGNGKGKKGKKGKKCPGGKVSCSGKCFAECCPGKSRPCYSGPEGTRNVGVCQDGDQTCLKDGTWDSACDGEVTPAGGESCNGLDDDCNGEVDNGAFCGPSKSCLSGRCCGPPAALCSLSEDCCSGICGDEYPFCA